VKCGRDAERSQGESLHRFGISVGGEDGMSVEEEVGMSVGG
jgi:hypothetical protein